MTLPSDLKSVIHILVSGRWYPVAWGTLRRKDSRTLEWYAPVENGDLPNRRILYAAACSSVTAIQTSEEDA